MDADPAGVPDAATVLDVRDLRIAFGRGADLVDGVSFSIAPREILGLVGESGSGKSLTSLAVMGLIPAPGRVSGRLAFRGTDLLALTEPERRALRGRRIAMIFQDPMSALTPVYRIGWQIAEQIRAHLDLSRRATETRVLDLLSAMGIADPRRVASAYPHQLSGGLRQRAMIAMALSCDPDLLIADEPTTALDVTVQAQILELIFRLRDEFGSAVLLITHDLGVVAQIADRVAVMYSGRIAERGPREAMFGMQARVHPYTAGLLGSIPRLHGPRASRLAAIAGSPPVASHRPPGCAFSPRCAHAQARCTAPPPVVPVGPAHEIACVLPSVAAEPGHV